MAPYLDKLGKLVWSLLPLQQCCTSMNTFVEQCVCVGGYVMPYMGMIEVQFKFWDLFGSGHPYCLNWLFMVP